MDHERRINTEGNGYSDFSNWSVSAAERKTLQQLRNSPMKTGADIVRQTCMITGDSEISRRSPHSDTYFTKSEVSVRIAKAKRHSDKQGLRRTPGAPKCAGFRCHRPQNCRSKRWSIGVS